MKKENIESASATQLTVEPGKGIRSIILSVALSVGLTALGTSGIWYFAVGDALAVADYLTDDTMCVNLVQPG